ncbi:unnamed protein product [Rotaria magnacalcarata]|uniref:Uncharacterized protein n=3 Tax=Rotaria magnacalcarata TaxID=392030 RepID=A0A814YRZ0_9BILA|nr:unnamed protein product [Rotaria magnacalcarata]
MTMEKVILSVIFLSMPIVNGLPSNAYYLIDINNSALSNESYCSNILVNQEVYRIPEQCQHHLLCTPYYCDDKSFRCIKIREALCCLYKYFQSNCQQDNTFRVKDLFRSVYFQISIEHGYCEINLERIERNDQAYCIADEQETQLTTTQTVPTTVPSPIRSSVKYFHRRPSLSSLLHHHHHHQSPHLTAVRQNYSMLLNSDHLRRFTIIENVPSTSSRIFINCFLIIIFLLSISV